MPVRKKNTKIQLALWRAYALDWSLGQCEEQSKRGHTPTGSRWSKLDVEVPMSANVDCTKNKIRIAWSIQSHEVGVHEWTHRSAVLLHGFVLAVCFLCSDHCEHDFSIIYFCEIKFPGIEGDVYSLNIVRFSSLNTTFCIELKLTTVMIRVLRTSSTMSSN